MSAYAAQKPVKPGGALIHLAPRSRPDKVESVRRVFHEVFAAACGETVVVG
jgi:hypothetical protein